MNKYKILKPFGGYAVGAVVQFSIKEAHALIEKKYIVEIPDEEFPNENKKAVFGGKK